MEAAAPILQLKLRVLGASNEREIDDSFATAAERGISALAIAPDVFFYSRSEQLAALAVRYALPAISPYRPFANGRLETTK
jgi:putative ABC transport system substrate-binding protein